VDYSAVVDNSATRSSDRRSDRPVGDGPHPVLLTRLPYGKDLSADTTYFDPVKAAAQGYVVVVQDVRGRYASEGKFTPFAHEFEDGFDSVEWASRLPGSNGER
jgi:uncharacterized protein